MKSPKKLLNRGLKQSSLPRKDRKILLQILIPIVGNLQKKFYFKGVEDAIKECRELVREREKKHYIWDTDYDFLPGVIPVEFDVHIFDRVKDKLKTR